MTVAGFEPETLTEAVAGGTADLKETDSVSGTETEAAGPGTEQGTESDPVAVTALGS